MEVTVKRKHLSPLTSLLVSISLVIGILVVDLTQTRIVLAARAQDGSQNSATGGASFKVANATLRGRVAASGLIVNGVATDAVFHGQIAVVKSVVAPDGAISFDGIIVNGGSPTPTDGIIVNGGSPTPPDGSTVNGGSATATDGIIVNGGAPPPTTHPHTTSRA